MKAVELVQTFGLEPKSGTVTGGAAHATRWRGRAVICVGIAVTVAVGFLHLLFLRSAGALWRDEVGGIHLACLPTWNETWQMLGRDSFPVLFPAVVRGWSWLGLGATDGDLRLLGFLIGLGCLGALWVNARLTGVRVPWLGLGLLGANVAMIRWGDSLRAYGLGSLLIILTVGLLWRVCQKPERNSFLLAAAAACLAVQTLYQNAFLVLAACLAGCAVCLRRKQWRTMALVLGVGMAAAVSLVPYANLVIRAQDWAVIAKVGFQPVRVWTNLKIALGATSSWPLWIWAALVLCALVAPLQALYRERKGIPADAADLPLFTAVALVCGVAGFVVFLYLAALPTEPWYFLPLMAFVVAAMEGGLGRWSARVHWPVAAVATCLVGALFPAAFEGVEARQTDVDLVAAQLERSTEPGDLILVYPCHAGISFNRYYSGPAVWCTFPDLPDFQFHRYDLLKEKLASSDPLAKVFQRAGRTLAAGGRVWIVGQLPWPRAGAVERAMPPPAPRPHVANGWRADWYDYEWARQLAFWLKAHADRVQLTRLSFPAKISAYEDLPLVEAAGWRGSPEPKDSTGRPDARSVVSVLDAP